MVVLVSWSWPRHSSKYNCQIIWLEINSGLHAQNAFPTNIKTRFHHDFILVFIQISPPYDKTTKVNSERWNKLNCKTKTSHSYFQNKKYLHIYIYKYLLEQPKKYIYENSCFTWQMKNLVVNICKMLKETGTDRVRFRPRVQYFLWNE